MSIFRRIPFQLGAELMLRSIANPAHKAKSKVVGVMENQFILIETPVFAVSEYIMAIVEGEMIGAYLHEGYLFTFRSQFQKQFSKNIICIDYPPDFEVEQLRKHPRIKVNLEVEVIVDEQTISGKVRDISEGGCLLEFPRMLSIFKGIELLVTFTLPNDVLVSNLRCKAANTKFYQIKKHTDVGVGFISPREEIAKIRDICRFCMRFKV